ncbi:pilus assembly protein PilA [Aliivibrio fischeri]|uniref:hypothetical protein n=1 Tax=Aliivibrio fischeri TaxID=668 RepID=UPI0007C4DDA0|nr:hypothetical protein [Aliivibrio fischeri]MCE7577293.1 pilus assembly protein PilA [Aliivibrio fischeri]MCE7589582.1 pilus assembly protein PilA [Aliivibrio fischeri]TGA68894.1 pilus assembly protein PilA [Aliivibrio fischeri]
MKSNKKFRQKELIVAVIILGALGFAAKPFFSNIESKAKQRVLGNIKTSVEHANQIASDDPLDNNSIIRLIKPEDNLLVSIQEVNGQQQLYIGFADSAEKIKSADCYFMYSQANQSSSVSSNKLETSGC